MDSSRVEDQHRGSMAHVSDVSLNPLPFYDIKPHIRRFVADKQVPYLVHFTDILNLTSIMRHGILSVEDLKQRNIPFRSNDDMRLDGHESAISLSIAHPNEILFYRWRQLAPQRRWVVLLVEPSVLWEKEVKFCGYNAADHRERKVGRWAHQGLASRRLMFADQPGLPSRKEQMLRDYDPTNVQAEALVFDSIPPEYIVGAFLNDGAGIDLAREALGDRQLHFVNDCTGMFGLRSTRGQTIR